MAGASRSSRTSLWSSPGPDPGRTRRRPFRNPSAVCPHTGRFGPHWEVRATLVVVIDLERPAVDVAPELLGWQLHGVGASGRIVEVEAYEPDDPASHSFRGQTPRNAAMFGPAGHLYVYRIYGIHLCANVVTGPPGRASAVLIRAIEPIEGTVLMAQRRGNDRPSALGSGPGRLCQALGISADHDGLDLLDAGSPVRLTAPPGATDRPIVNGPRIGISKAVDRPWRWGLADSPHLSRRFEPTA